MATFTPRFSVIIPNFNNGPTLARAINSVLTQTTPAHEILVIDDGSTDESKQIAESFGEKVRYFWQPNSGVSVARNLGANMATGEWLAFLDADDEYLPNRLEVHASWIKDEPDLDFLLGDQESRTPDGEFIELYMAKSSAGQELLQKYSNTKRIPLSPCDFGSLTSDGFAEIRTISLPRAKFLALGGFSLSHKIGEDLHFFIRLFAVSTKAGVVPEVLSTYYIYQSSALRKDPLNAMKLFVVAIESLDGELRLAPPALRRGFQEKCRQNRLSLAYAFLRVNQKSSAIASVLPSFFRAPSLLTLKDIASICRGFPDSLPVSDTTQETPSGSLAR